MPAKSKQIPPRTQSRRVAPPSLARRLAGLSGATLRLIGAPIAARPALSGGIAGVAALFVAVAANAFYAQPSRHPKPMMTTRGGPLPTDVTLDESENDGTLMAVPLVLEVQTALAATGHYGAALDGRPGKATAAAIRAFQKENGLRVDGEPSPGLLAKIETAKSAETQMATGGTETRYASVEERMSAPEPKAEAKPASHAPAVPVPRATELAAGQSDLVRRIQSGLANAEVADLKADGILGEQTRSAIRTFEALEGLDVTGAPDERILKRLIEIGAAE